MSEQPRDIGDFTEVPQDRQLDVDPTPEYNADAGFDIEMVPDGEYVELSTASADEPLASESEDYEDEGDGTPLHFLSPADPEYYEDGDE